MTQITSTSGLVPGLSRLNAKPTLEQIGRAPPKALTIEQETENLSGLGVAHKLLFAEKSNQQLAIGHANRGLSLIQTAESALHESISALTELRALAVRASSDTISEDERDNLQEKADELIERINEIAESTTFASKKIFDGSLDSIVFEVGGSESDLISLVALKADAIGLGLQPGTLQTVSDRAQLTESERGTQGIQEGDSDIGDITDLKIKLKSTELTEQINIADVAYGGPLENVRDTSQLINPLSDDFGSGIAKTAAERINDIRRNGHTTFKNIVAKAETRFQSSDIQDDDFAGQVNTSAATSVKQGAIAKGDLRINGYSVEAVAFSDNDSSGTLSNTINRLSDKTGVTASVDVSGNLQLSAADGRDIVVSTSSVEVTNRLFGGGEARFTDKFTNLRITGTLSLYSEEEIRFLGSHKKNLGVDNFSLDNTKLNVSTDNNISMIDLSSTTGANLAIESVDSGLKQIRSFQRGLQQVNETYQTSLSSVTIGNAQPSLSSFMANLSKTVMNTSANTAVAAQANADASSVLFILRTAR